MWLWPRPFQGWLVISNLGLGIVGLWYGIVGFNIPLDTLQVISKTILQVRWPNQQCNSTEGWQSSRSIYLYGKYEDSNLSCSRGIIGALKLKVSHVTLSMPHKGWFGICMLGLDTASLCTKCDHSSFRNSRDMVGVQQNLNGSRDLTTSLSGMVCDPWASTCYDQPIYQILSLYLSISTQNMKATQNVENVVVWCT